MNENYMIQARVAGIVLNDDKILLVKQKVSKDRNWSLPGGRLEKGESVETAIVRELKEETGYEVEVVKFLYLCEKVDKENTLLHLTFLVKINGGELTLPTNEFDANPISDVRWVKLNDLNNYGFSENFMDTIKNDFPKSGSYMGSKSNIGL